MKRSIILTLHLAYWLVYTFFIVSTLIIAGSNFNGNKYESFYLNVFLAVSCFYTFYFLLVPKFLATKKVKLFVVSGLGTCIMSSVCIVSIHVLLGYSKGPTGTATASFSASAIVLNWLMVIAFHVVLGMIHGLLATFMKGFFTWYNEIHLKELLEKKNVEAQMSLIKARINPHFLFNTLNNIDALIKSNASLASLYLQKLCGILRFALYENKPERIKVDKEINIMREYIELESIRTSNKNFISFEVTGEATNVLIAPMLFIPFLENAFKHSGNKKVNTVIHVKLDIMEDKGIRFHCRNLVDHQQQISSDGGLGIALIKQRLSLLYPDKHNLLLKKENDYFEVNLTVNTR